MELKKATIQCTNPDCPWQGRSDEYKVVRIAGALSLKHSTTGTSIPHCKPVKVQQFAEQLSYSRH
jgi:molybdenum cofactor biosynthesis enzyme